jgi:signal transduction histidine kinase/ActR/RegA family two-component response regulator
MNKVVPIRWVLPPDYLNAAIIVSLLSVLVLVGLFFYLNRYTGRRYFSTWTMGWLFYAGWLGLGLFSNGANPFLEMLKHWCVGASAALLFWGSIQFLKVPARSALFYCFIGFLLAWSYVGAYHLSDPFQIQVPIFGIIGLASLATAFSFYRLRKHREFVGAGLLTFGFVLWGLYLSSCPFFLGNRQMVGTGFLISAVLQLFIAVSMIILVLEEARAANEMVLEQIRSCHLAALELGTGLDPANAQYQGLFDQASLTEKLRFAYRDLRQAQEQSLQQERLQAMAQMSRGIAHDINNALTPILGYTSLLLRSGEELPENVLRYISGIKFAGEKIAQSVSCIRDFYRKSEGNGALMPVELSELVQEVVELSRPQWHDAPAASGIRVELKSEVGADLPQVAGIKNELRETLSQLILNAVQAMPQGGTIHLRAGARMRKAAPRDAKPEWVWLEVADTGIGMDGETRKRCLEPFFSTKARQGAKGLGLSRVFGVMQRHEGHLEIESEPDKGSVIRLVFPLENPAPAAEPATTLDPVLLRSLKVLCIDDEAPVLDVLKIILKHGGHKVEVALDGETGIEAFRAAKALKEPFDIVLTDLGMPRIDGRQVAKVIKEEGVKTPVIMLTGWGDIMRAEGNHPENIDMVLSKPPQVSELLLTLTRLTART